MLHQIKIFFFTLNILILCAGCTHHCSSFKESEIKIYGLDVSHYQDEFSQINWIEVSNNSNPKIDFTYIRTTMGADGIDTAFQYNYENAKKNNIKIGVYHYYRPNENSKQQFENFSKNNKEIGELPPMDDIEEKGNIGVKKIREELSLFLKLIEEEYGIRPIIYAPQKFYNLYLRNHFNNYDLWIARQNGINQYPENNNPKTEPFLFDKKCPLIWQYSGTGSVNGIEGKVDLNITNQIFWEQ